jgi:hypothetical protein
MDEAMISRIVANVIKAVLPEVLKEARDAASEAVEASGKKTNLVLIGLPENQDPKIFVQTACIKMKVNEADVTDVFRDGKPPDKGSRIVKIKFQNSNSRHSFLIGFHSARDSFPGAENSWVRPDLTFRQRQADKVLREELKTRRLAGEIIKISRGQIVPKV